MALSNELIKAFVKSTNDTSQNGKESTFVYATAKKSGNSIYAMFDGSDILTPVRSTIDISDGDRVMILVKNHSGTIVSNYTSPAVNNDSFGSFKNVTAENIKATNALIENVAGDFAIFKLGEFETLKSKQAEFESATAENFKVTKGEIENLSGDFASFKKGEFEEVKIKAAEIDKLSGDFASFKVGEFENLKSKQAEFETATAENFKSTKAEIDTVSGNIAEFETVTAEKITGLTGEITSISGEFADYKIIVSDEFSAHTARIDTVIGDLASYKTTVTDELIAAKGWMTEGAIGNAQISSVDANKLTAGTIDTALVTIAGSDGKLQIADNTMKISDANRVRVQVGKDASGDYTLAVWDKAGNLIWDALGATDKTIQRKIIRDNVIADDAAIQALKIDFQSFDTVLTDQGVTISGTVVQVGSKTLNVALSEQTQINTSYSEQLASHASKITANEKAIALKVSSQTYEKDKTTMESTLQTVESSVNVMDGQITALVQDVTVLQGDYDGLDSRTAKLELDSDNFAVELSSTKKTVSDNYTSLKQYTDTAKSSAISTAAADATSKANKALADAKTDATTKADAAQTAAIASAAADATSKADAALKSAQSQIDSTNAVVATHTTTLSKHDTRIAANENAISLKVWSKDVEEAVSAIEVGGRNLLLKSGVEHSNNTYDVAKYTPSSPLTAGEIYTISVCVTPGMGLSHISPYLSIGYARQCVLPISGAGKQIISRTFKAYYHADRPPTVDTRMILYRFPNDGTVTSNTTIHWIKVEKGNRATDWTPAPEDVDSAIATVDGKFASYSTTVEMQSAIEVAKTEINLAVSESYTTKTELSDLKRDTSNAKLGNLIKNGYGEYLNNTNFDDGVFTRGDCPEGCYGYFTGGTSELIPFDPTSQYDLSFYCRRNANATDSDRNYFSIVPVDIDGHTIGVGNVITGFDKNLYYLSKDLKNGDTVAYFTDLSNWNTNTEYGYQRRFLIFGYKDSTGYTYPDGTYSRYMYDSVYASDDDVNKVNNAITLAKPWLGKAVKAGTCIGHVTGGNIYCYYGQIGLIGNTDWKQCSARVYADAESKSEECRRLAYAKYIKIFLFNGKADYAGIYLSKTTIDADAQSKITSLETWKTEASQKITKDGIIATVGNYYAYQSDLAGAENRITQAESKIEQQAGEIALTVKEQDVTGNYIVGKLNLSSTTAKIAAKNIDLSGYVTVSSLKTAGATTIDGSNITTGLISADRIDAESLMTKKLTATNLTVTGNSKFSGVLDGATGTFAGSLSAASGTFAGTLSGATGTFAGSLSAATGSFSGAVTATSITAKNEYYIHASSGTGTKARALYAADGSIGSTLMVGDGFSTLHLCGLLVNKNSGQVLCGEDGSWGLTAGSVRAQGFDYGGQFNAQCNGYGTIFRNDGNAFYILLSNQGSPYSFNDLRPFIINLASGKVEVKTDFYCTNWGSGTTVRRPVASASSDGKQIQWIESKKGSSGTYYITVNGQFAGSDFSSKNINCTTSDIRLKTNVVDCNMDALSIINQIQVREFDWKESGIHQKIGFVADELEAIDSNLAFGGGYNEDGSMDVKSVNEFYLVGYLTKGIQELHTTQLAQADELLTHKSQIDYLLDENAALKKRVKELEKQTA